MKSTRATILSNIAFSLGVVTTSLLPGCGTSLSHATESGGATASEIAKVKTPAIDRSANALIQPGDWVQWGGTSYRNNTPIATNIPVDWGIGDFDRKTGQWIPDEARNIRWVASVGSQTYGNPVIADGRVFVGTNNGAGYLPRYPADVDLGCLLCFDARTGDFLWQDSNEKLPTGRVHDWPQQGVCSSPLSEGDRLWYVTNRGEVVCLDTKGFLDDEDDGPLLNQWGRLFDVRRGENPAADVVAPALADLARGVVPEMLRQHFSAAAMELPDEVQVTTVETGKKWRIDARIDGVDRQCHVVLKGPLLSAYKVITPHDKQEADVVWRFDMMAELGVSQHNMCSCSVTALGDILFVNTSNGVDESHINIPAPNAPSFLAMNKRTGKVCWTDRSPAESILHGQWSSPAVGRLGGVDQVIFGAGDGWVYAFRADEGRDGKPELLWKFDANPKESVWILGGAGTRNNIIATPVIYDGLVYVAVGQDPEHGEGIGHLWCIDPTKRGNVSPTLAVKAADTSSVIPHRREQAVKPELGETTVPNPNSAAVWEYCRYDQNGDGQFDFEEEMHRSLGTVAIQNDLLFVADYSGLFHCLDAKTGVPHWTHDMLAAAWGSPLIVNGHVYIGDEDGDVCVFRLTSEKHEPIAEINMGNSIYSSPVVANGVLYIANRTHVFAIAAE